MASKTVEGSHCTNKESGGGNVPRDVTNHENAGGMFASGANVFATTGYGTLLVCVTKSTTSLME